MCTRAKDFAGAEGIFDEMREKGVRPRSATYLKYIYACFRLKHPDKAFEMLVNMEKEWRVPDAKNYLHMLNLFKYANHAEGKARCLQGLVQDMQHMGGGGGMALNSLTPEVVGGLFREAQEKKQPEEVISLAATLKDAKIPLDRFQQVGVIFAQMSLAQYSGAFSSLVDLYDSGYSMPERGQEQLAEELAKDASSVDEAYYLLESRKAEKLKVPLAAVNVVIEACAHMADLDRAFATWAELEQLEVQPDAGTYNALLHTCVRTRELASGRRLLARMAQDGIKPNAVTFLHQTILHIVSREEQQAFECLAACREAGLTPHWRMYNTLINYLVRGNRLEHATELLEQMESDGHKVSNALRQKVSGQSSPFGGR